MCSAAVEGTGVYRPHASLSSCAPTRWVGASHFGSGVPGSSFSADPAGLGCVPYARGPRVAQGPSHEPQVPPPLLAFRRGAPTRRRPLRAPSPKCAVRERASGRLGPGPRVGRREARVGPCTERQRAGAALSGLPMGGLWGLLSTRRAGSSRERAGRWMARVGSEAREAAAEASEVSVEGQEEWGPAGPRAGGGLAREARGRRGTGPYATTSEPAAMTLGPAAPAHPHPLSPPPSLRRPRLRGDLPPPLALQWSRSPLLLLLSLCPWGRGPAWGWRPGGAKEGEEERALSGERRHEPEGAVGRAWGGRGGGRSGETEIEQDQRILSLRSPSS